MKKLAFAVALSALAAVTVAEPTSKTQKKTRPDPIAAAAAARARVAKEAAKEGGLVERKGVAVGKVCFIDTQSVVDKSVVIGSVEGFDRLLLKYDIHVEKMEPGKPIDLKNKAGATVAVVLVYDDETPGLLAAPDENWAVVNFKRLEEGLKSDDAKKKFFSARCSKQIKRALVAACGGINSSFKGNMLSIATVPELDHCIDLLPVDRTSAVRERMKALGMKPRRLVFYSTACEEGWAPQPTNDVQKAIWDKVHTLPTEPIRILPESQKK